MPGRVELDLRLARSTERPIRSDRGAPFRLLVLGDLSGRASRGLAKPETVDQRPLLAADLDTFDEVLKRLSPTLRLTLPGGRRTEVDVGDLDDFHPDSLWTRLPLFEDLPGLRRRLLDPLTAAEATEEVRRTVGTGLEASSLAEAPSRPTEADSDTLERLFGRRPTPAAREEEPARSGVDLTGFLRSVVTPHAAPEPDPHQSVYLSAVDEAAGDRMRALLHHPSFQALEALWRSVHGLITAVELGEDLQVFLLDATAEELTGDLLRTGPSPEHSGLFRLLVEQYGPDAPGGEPWTAMVGAYGFGPSEEDTRLLGALGALASRAGGPFLARALPAILGCSSPEECADPRAWQPLSREAAARWEALRRSPAARWVGLALPRVLLRLPYGTATDEVEGFAFEEFTPVRQHEAYLWGNPAFLCARLLAEEFLRRGQAAQPEAPLEMGDLPAHAFVEDGEPRLQPCAEAILPERAAVEMLGRGIMPVLAYRNRNAVRLLRLQSLGDPQAGLAGPWS